MTLDYEDFQFLEKIFGLHEKERSSRWMILHFLSQNPEVAQINSNCGLKFKKRFDTQSKRSSRGPASRHALIVGCGSIGEPRNLMQLGIKEIYARDTKDISETSPMICKS